MKTTPLSRAEFLRTVLELRPPIAVFDCDGTLWSKDAGTLFMNWSLEQRMVDDERAHWIAERHAHYRKGNVGEAVMCGEMSTVYAGIAEEELRKHAREFFCEDIAPHVFPEMIELVAQLREAGTDVWAVSSTNAQMIEAALQDFGIPSEKIFATRVRISGGVLTGELLAVPTGAAKREALQQAGITQGHAAFGNSIHDVAMLESARWSFAVNPNPDLLHTAQQRGWPVYWPDGTFPAVG